MMGKDLVHQFFWVFVSYQPCLPFLVCPSFLQLLSQRWASYLPVHLCLLQWIQHKQNPPSFSLSELFGPNMNCCDIYSL